jgi:hypothetical protein
MTKATQSASTRAMFGQTNFDDYIIHTTTRNLSFIRVFKSLKGMGIKNNKFFLRLYDADLLNVDPHSKHLSPEIQSKILYEIARNPFYFIREVVRIAVPGGTLKFELHRGNLALLWALINNLHTIILLPRQRYKTISIATLLTWIYHFATNNTSMLFSNKSLGDAQNNLKRFKDIVSNLPLFIRNIINNKGDINNLTSILSEKRNNKIDIAGQVISEEAADKQGRGMSLPVCWWDEFAFLKYNDIIYKSAAPAISKVSEIAEKEGRPFAKIVSTTPNNLDSPHGIFCKQLIDEACPFTEEMYDWTKREIKNFIKDNSSNDFLYIKFTWQELGLTKEWYEKECRALTNDKLTIRREIDLEWTKSSDNSIFTEEQLDIIFNIVTKNVPLKTLTLDVKVEELDEDKNTVKGKYTVVLYKELERDKTYFIGSDVGGGLGRDSSTLIITDPKTLEPYGFFKNSKINTNYFSSIIHELIVNHLPNSILFIENNNYGKAVLDNLIRRIPKNLFFDYKVADKDKAKTIKKTSKNITYGINTTPASRPLMFDLLMQYVQDKPYLFGFSELYEEIKTLIYTKTGKIEHDIGAHDDIIMAYNMILYAIAYSNNIARYLRETTTVTVNLEAVRAKPDILETVGNNHTKETFKPQIDVGLEEYMAIALAGDLTPTEIIERLKAQTKKEDRGSGNKSILNTFLNLNK